jgi:hypothetical protein
MTTRPENLGLMAGSHWVIQDDLSEPAYGIALNDERIFRAMQASPKAVGSFLVLGYLEKVPIELISPSEYKVLTIYYSGYMFGASLGPNLAFRQTDKPLDEEEMNYWEKRF